MDFNQLIQPEDITDQFAAQDIEQNKLCAIFAYLIPFLFFLPGISFKDSPAAKFTSNQSFLLFLGDICAMFLWLIFHNIPVLGFLVSIPGFLLMVLGLIGVIDAASGKIKKLPVLKAIPEFEVFK